MQYKECVHEGKKRKRRLILLGECYYVTLSAVRLGYHILIVLGMLRAR